MRLTNATQPITAQLRERIGDMQYTVSIKRWEYISVEASSEEEAIRVAFENPDWNAGDLEGQPEVEEHTP